MRDGSSDPGGEARESSQLIGLAFDALPSIAALLDREGRIAAVNEAWRRSGDAHGFTAERWGVGLDYLAPCRLAASQGNAEAAAVATGVLRVLGDPGESHESVYGCHSSDGKRWFRVRVVGVSQRDPLGALVVHDDVTRERIGPGALAPELDLLRLVHDAVISTDMTGTIRSWNRAAEGLYGYPEEEALGRSIEMLYFPEDVWIPGERVFEPLRSQEAVQMRLRTRHKNGAAVLVDLRLAAIRDSTGAPIGVVGCSNDVTERSTAEEALAGRNLELEAIFRAQPDLMFRLDSDATIVEFRAGRHSDLYLPPEEFLGRRMADVVPPELGTAFGGWLDRLHREGGVVTNEYDLAVPGGTKHFEARLVPFGAGGALMWVRDVTLRHAALEHQRRLMDELDHRVKNVLSAILGIADETMQHASSLEGFADAFRGRVATMASAHEALARGRWSAIDFRTLAEDTLAPYLETYAGRVTFAGPPVRIPGRWVLPLALVMHELMTNAIKHGALAVDTGRLHVAWSEPEQTSLILAWNESGAPRVARRLIEGTGLHLIEDLVTLELDGLVELDLEDGLHCRITLPNESLVAASSDLASTPGE